MRKHITSFLLLPAIPFMVCGCGSDSSSARATCALSFPGAGEFDYAVVILERFRDTGITKQDALPALLDAGACAPAELQPDETTEGCEDCFQAIIDLVWG